MTIPHSSKPLWQQPCACNGGVNHWTARNFLFPVTLHETLSWDWESRSYHDTVLHKELNQTMEYMSKTTLWRLGTESAALGGYITFPIVHQPLESSSGAIVIKDWMFKSKMAGGTFKLWDAHIANATWLLKDLPIRLILTHQNFYILYRGMRRKQSASAKGTAFARGPGCT